MELIDALAVGLAIFAGLMAVLPTRAQPAPGLGLRVRAMYVARIGGARALLAQARLEISPRSYLALSILAPLGFGAVGFLLSVPMAILGLIVGAFVPRWYVRYLVGSEARAASDDAPRVLRAMVNRAAAGGTYPDLFVAAAEGARHRWVKADFEEILGRYYANEPPAEALVEVRRRQAGRNLALVYDALITLTRTHQPASAAAEVLGSLGEAARSNQSIARQAAAESRGLRLQAAILAVVIPALFLYLSVANTELLGPVMSTPVGRYLILPAAALLEVIGIVLSWRVTRLEA
jgi:Flp pilus assembly protein TadB